MDCTSLMQRYNSHTHTHTHTHTPLQSHHHSTPTHMHTHTHHIQSHHHSTPTHTRTHTHTTYNHTITPHTHTQPAPPSLTVQMYIAHHWTTPTAYGVSLTTIVDCRFGSAKTGRGARVSLLIDSPEYVRSQASLTSLITCSSTHPSFPLSLSPPALPVIHPLAQTIVFTLGETILVPCQAWGHPKPTVSWYQEGEQVGEDGRVQQVNGSLLIRNASFADEGEFQCFATNRAGVDSVNITLFMTAEREALLLLLFFTSSFPSGLTDS